jgi:hypothetical protein
MFKAMDKWLIGYLKSVLHRPRRASGTRHLIFCLCDHYEPFRGGAEKQAARQIVQKWIETYPKVVDGYFDADGVPPQHTFFYPEEDYDDCILDQLAGFCGRGFGEVEVHLHHRHDTAEGLRKKLEVFRDVLHQRHGLLGVENAGTTDFRLKTIDQERDTASPSISHSNVNGLRSTVSPVTPRYGFIHGNWALCNSRPDGDWCGVNEELGVLVETGCYADFTFPSAPSATQPRMVNAIYYAKDRPGAPRGADFGARVGVGGLSSLSSLLLITGPLALNWRRRKWGVLPRVENGDISGGNPPSAERVRLWVRQEIGVRGKADWVFVKLYTHGCVPSNTSVVLGEGMRVLHETLQRDYNDGDRWQLHYVTAREMYNLVKAAEAGKEGTPGLWRDFMVGRPRVRG